MKFRGSNGFLVIPTEISRDPELLKKPKSIILMGEIITMLNATDNFYMSNAELAKRLDCSVRWIRNVLQFLENKELIQREVIIDDETKEVKGRKIRAGKALKNLALLNVPKEPESLTLRNYSSLPQEVQTREGEEPQFQNLRNHSSSKEEIYKNKDIRINNKIYSSSHDEHSSLKNDQIENEFNMLWDMYPRKQGKKQALTHYKSWRKKSPTKHTFEFMQSKLKEYKEYLSANNTPTKFIAMGSTWFNGRFEDDYSIRATKTIDKQPQINKTIAPQEAEFIRQKQKEMDEIEDEDLPF